MAINATDQIPKQIRTEILGESIDDGNISVLVHYRGVVYPFIDETEDVFWPNKIGWRAHLFQYFRGQ